MELKIKKKLDICICFSEINWNKGKCLIIETWEFR